MDFLYAEEVFAVGIAVVCLVFGGTHAGTAGFRGEVGIDADDICHGEKGGQAGADFGEEMTVFAFFGLSSWSAFILIASSPGQKKKEKKTYMTGTLQAKMTPNRATSHLEVYLVHPIHDGHVSIRVYYEHMQ